MLFYYRRVVIKKKKVWFSYRQDGKYDFVIVR